MHQQDIVMGLITTIKVKKQDGDYALAGNYALASIGTVNLCNGCIPP